MWLYSKILMSTNSIPKQKGAGPLISEVHLMLPQESQNLSCNVLCQQSQLILHTGPMLFVKQEPKKQIEKSKCKIC